MLVDMGTARPRYIGGSAPLGRSGSSAVRGRIEGRWVVPAGVFRILASKWPEMLPEGPGGVRDNGSKENRGRALAVISILALARLK
jgi:hypothetical protein